MATPGTMVTSILNTAIQFFKEPKNRQRIQHDCIDPVLNHILDRIFPYIILTCIIFSLILLMSIASVGLLVFQLRIQTAAIVPSIIPSPV